MTKEKRIHFVRHGTPEGLEAFLAGSTDLALSEQGKTEAEKTGKWFAEQSFDGLIYSSPLSRAHDTAKLIVSEIQKKNESFNGDITIREKLTECDLGILEGMKKEELDAYQGSGEFSAWLSDPFGFVFPKGESFAGSGRRFAEAVDEILKENENNDEEIMIAAHMCVIEAYLVLKGLIEPSMDLVENPVPCASITTVLYGKDGEMTIERLGWLPE